MTGSASCSLVYKTVWLSDIHLGNRHCKAEYLLEFLNKTECKTLYLVGDVIDILNLKRQWHWPSAHSEVIQQLLAKAENGTEVIYVGGNHDELFRQFNGRNFGNIKIERQVEHETGDGKRLLVTHGDEFEHWIKVGKLTKIIGCVSYDVLLMLNRVFNAVRRWRGKPYWSFAAYVKNRNKKAKAAIHHFEAAAAQYAGSNGYDGVVCGHLHQPEIKHIDGVLYCNDGDWIESCSAMVERIDGGLELLHWADMRHSTKVLQATSSQVLDEVIPLKVG